MRLLLRLIIVIPLLLLALYFAESNRGPVKVSLEPLPGGALFGSSLSFEAPLFLVVLISMAIGVLLGGFSSWLAHREIRRTAKLAKAEAAKLQSEVGELRRAALAALPSAGAGKSAVGGGKF